MINGLNKFDIPTSGTTIKLNYILNDTTSISYYDNFLLFDGIDDTMTVTVPTNFFGTGNWSFSFWLRLDILQISRLIWHYQSALNNYMTITVNASFQLEIQFFSAGAGRQYLTRTANPLKIDTWYYITVIRNGGLAILYMNGTAPSMVLLVSSLLAGDSLSNNALLHISSISGIGFLAGAFSQIYYQTTIITLAENILRYNNGVGAPPTNVTGLQLHLKLDEITGYTAFDSSINSYDGTLVSYTNNPLQWQKHRRKKIRINFNDISNTTDILESGAITQVTYTTIPNNLTTFVRQYEDIIGIMADYTLSLNGPVDLSSLRLLNTLSLEGSTLGNHLTKFIKFPSPNISRDPYFKYFNFVYNTLKGNLDITYYKNFNSDSYLRFSNSMIDKILFSPKIISSDTLNIDNIFSTDTYDTIIGNYSILSGNFDLGGMTILNNLYLKTFIINNILLTINSTVNSYIAGNYNLAFNTFSSLTDGDKNLSLSGLVDLDYVFDTTTGVIGLNNTLTNSVNIKFYSKIKQFNLDYTQNIKGIVDISGISYYDMITALGNTLIHKINLPHKLNDSNTSIDINIGNPTAGNELNTPQLGIGVNTPNFGNIDLSFVKNVNRIHMWTIGSNTVMIGPDFNHNVNGMVEFSDLNYRGIFDISSVTNLQNISLGTKSVLSVNDRLGLDRSKNLILPGPRNIAPAPSYNLLYHSINHTGLLDISSWGGGTVNSSHYIIVSSPLSQGINLPIKLTNNVITFGGANNLLADVRYCGTADFSAISLEFSFIFTNMGFNSSSFIPFKTAVQPSQINSHIVNVTAVPFFDFTTTYAANINIGSDNTQLCLTRYYQIANKANTANGSGSAITQFFCGINSRGIFDFSAHFCTVLQSTPSMPLMTGFKFGMRKPNSNSQSISIGNNNFGGALDLSMLFVQDSISINNTPNLTNIITASAPLASNNVFTQFSADNSNLIGLLDISKLTFAQLANPLTSVSFTMVNNIRLTSIALPPSARRVTTFTASGCSNMSPQSPETASHLGYIDFTVITFNHVTGSSIIITLTDNSMTATEVNHILVDLDTTGWTGGTLSIAGTNSAPDGASGGFDGLTAKANLIGKNWTVTTN